MILLYCGQILNKKNGLSKYKQRKIMGAFAVDLMATQTAHLLGFDRKTVNRYFGLFRRAIFAHQNRQREALVGVIECDESYFGQARPRGVPGPRKRGLRYRHLYASPDKSRNHEILATDESERVVGLARLVGQMESMVRSSDNSEGFNAPEWLSR